MAESAVAFVDEVGHASTDIFAAMGEKVSTELTQAMDLALRGVDFDYTILALAERRLFERFADALERGGVDAAVRLAGSMRTVWTGNLSTSPVPQVQQTGSAPAIAAPFIEGAYDQTFQAAWAAPRMATRLVAV